MDRAAELRQKIGLYRQYLAQGIEGDRAVVYLRELNRLQAELDEFEGREKKE